jgi:hypothetical protein
MQTDSALLVLALCGFAVACSGVTLFALFFVARRLGGQAIPFLSFLGQKTNFSDETDMDVPIPNRHVNFRAKADAADFDDALAKYGGQAAGTRPRPEIDSELPPSRFDDLKSPRSPQDRRRKPGDYYDQDEIFGGLLDADGDGDVDY